MPVVAGREAPLEYSSNGNREVAFSVRQKNGSLLSPALSLQQAFTRRLQQPSVARVGKLAKQEPLQVYASSLVTYGVTHSISLSLPLPQRAQRPSTKPLMHQRPTKTIDQDSAS